MKLLRPVVTIACIVATFVNADDTLAAKAATQTTAAELQPLQGTWEGVEVGDTSWQKITITIAGNSLHFHRDANFWFETTIALPSGTYPKQLLATIKGSPSSQASSHGKVVGAIFKIENGTLTLVTSGEMPESFEDKGGGLTRYELRKVQPQRKNSQAPKAQ